MKEKETNENQILFGREEEAFWTQNSLNHYCGWILQGSDCLVLLVYIIFGLNIVKLFKLFLSVRAYGEATRNQLPLPCVELDWWSGVEEWWGRPRIKSGGPVHGHSHACACACQVQQTPQTLLSISLQNFSSTTSQASTCPSILPPYPLIWQAFHSPHLHFLLVFIQPDSEDRLP